MEITELTSSELAKVLTTKGLSEERANVLIDNEISGFIFLNLTDDDVHRMFPGKVGVVRWILLIREAILAARSNTRKICSSGEGAWDVVGDVLPELDATKKTSRLAVLEYKQGNNSGFSPPQTATSSSTALRSPLKCALREEASDDSLLQTRTEVSSFTTEVVPRDPTITLPTFSPKIQECLKNGDVLPMFHKLIEECAQHILKKGDIRTKSQYAKFGEEMYKQYKCIGFPTNSKQQPWSFFCIKLSQKLRNTRLRISKDMSKKGRKAPSEDVISITVESAKKSLEAEITREKPNLDILKVLFRSLYEDRRARLMKMDDDNVSKVIEEFPLLANITFVREDFNNKYSVTMDKILENYIDMIQRLDFIFNENVVVDKNSGLIHDDVFLQISLLLRLQDALTDRRLSRTSIGQAIQVVDKESLSSTKREKGPPILLIVRDGDRISCAMVLAEEMSLPLETTTSSDCLLTFLLDFMACYYAWNISYPKCFQVLGFFLDHILDCKDMGVFKTSRHKIFDKAFCEAF